MGFARCKQQTCRVTITPDFIEVGEASFGDVPVRGVAVVEEEPPVPAALTLEPKVLLPLS